MSVPTSEVPRAAQNEIRALFDGGAWGRLSERSRDVIIQWLHAMRGVRDYVDMWITLVNPGPGESESRLAALPDDDQLRIVRTFGSTAHSLGRALTVLSVLRQLAVGGHPQRIKTRALAIVTRTLDEALGEWTRDYLSNHLPDRCSALAGMLADPEFGRVEAEDDRVAILDVLDACSPTGLSFLRELLQPAPARWLSDTRISFAIAPMFALDIRHGTHHTALYWLQQLANAPRLHPPISYHAHETTLSWQYTVRHLETVRRHRRIETRVVSETRTAEVHTYDQDFGSIATDWGPTVHRMVALGDLVSELARPDQFLNQDNRGTCGCTTFLHRLAKSQPGEYARIASELLRTGHSTLSNGEALDPPTDAFPADDSNRSGSERLMQAACMNSWQSGFRRPGGQHTNYHNVRAATADNTNPTGEQHDGFDGRYDMHRDNNDANTFFTKLYGRPYRFTAEYRHAGRFGRHLIQELRAHFAAHPNNPAMVALSWVHGGHFFEVVDIDPPTHPSPRVQFWNPWGAAVVVWARGFPIRITQTSVEPTGTTMRNRRTRIAPDGTVEHLQHGIPVRQTIDDSRGLQTMTVAELSSLVEAFFVPADL